MNKPIEAMDILLYSSESIVDMVVRLGTLSTFNHVAVAVSELEMIEALPGGVRLSPIRPGAIACRLMHNIEKNDEYVSTLKKYIGYQYGLIADAFAGLGMSVEIPHQLECAQLGGHALSIMGYKSPTPPTPQQLFVTALEEGGIAFSPVFADMPATQEPPAPTVDTLQPLDPPQILSKLENIASNIATDLFL